MRDQPAALVGRHTVFLDRGLFVRRVDGAD
jgi:hypothetical protein